MTPEQKQRAMQMLRRFSQTTPMTRTADNAAVAMAALLQDLVDAPEPEPFGYFKSEPFGWTDCAETDDGAIALYTAPSEPKPVARVTGYYAGYLSIATVDGRVLPTGTALYTAPPAPSVPDVLPATNPSQISSFTEPVEWLPGGFRIEHFTKDDPMLTDEANAERRFFVTRIESPYHKDGVWFGATAEDALAKACAAIGVDYANAPPAPSVPDGWMRAIDEAMVVHHIGIADRADSYEVAKKKLNALLAINSDIARDCSEAPADLARDAARYRWLLDSNWYVGPDSFYCTGGGELEDYQNKNNSAESLDAAVDAAIAAKKGGAK